MQPITSDAILTVPRPFLMNLKSIAFAIPVLLYTTINCCLADSNQPSVPMATSSVFSYLTTSGQRLHCYFTIEEYYTGNKWNEISDRQIPDDPSISTIDGLISKLHKDLPDVEILPDEKNKQIYHLVPQSVAKDREYFLNQPIDMTYIGTLGKLPLQISKQINVPFDWQRVFTQQDGVVLLMDPTPVNFDVKKTSIRTILSEFIPLPGYSQILWRTWGGKYNGKQSTSIFFLEGCRFLKPQQSPINDTFISDAIFRVCGSFQ